MIERISYFPNVGFPANAINLFSAGAQDEFYFWKGATEVNSFYGAIKSALNNPLKPLSTRGTRLGSDNLLLINRAGGAVSEKRINADNLVVIGPKLPISKKSWRARREFENAF